MKPGAYCGAVDIGGTKISIGIVDRSGRVLVRDTIPTPTAGDPLETVRSMDALLRAQARGMHIPWNSLDGIGIGASGPVDSVDGIISNPYTLPGFKDYPMAEALSSAAGLPVKIENDVNVSLLGEVKLGQLQQQNVLFTAFGTGVGVAVWFAGTGLYRAGGSRYHPELGHVIVDTAGPSCYCGNQGCLESTLSGKALNQGARDLGFADFDVLFQAAGNGDTVAASYLELSERRLQRAFWTLLTIFKPDILFLGGGIIDRYHDFMHEIITRRLTPIFGFFDPFEVRKASRDHGSAMSGASALIFGMEL